MTTAGRVDPIWAGVVCDVTTTSGDNKSMSKTTVANNTTVHMPLCLLQNIRSNELCPFCITLVFASVWPDIKAQVLNSAFNAPPKDPRHLFIDRHALPPA